MPFLALLFSVAFFVSPASSEERSLVVGAHQSESLKIPGLSRAAVADSKIAKVRAIPPETLLISGLKPGKTTVRAWDSSEKEHAFRIEVLSVESFSAMEGDADGVIKISIEFLELDSSLKEGLGVHWPEMIRFSGSGSVHGDLAMSGLNYAAGFSTAEAWITHLVREGWAKLLARPDIFVRLGEEAEFKSGGEFPISTSQESYGRALRRVEWKPYGIQVKVRPQSGDGLHIVSTIRVDISELNPSEGMDGIPSITRRFVETKMNSVDGETVVLSGLVRKATANSKEGLPILSSIPLIGHLLFGGTSSSREETEIFMAVTLSFATKKTHEEERSRFTSKFEGKAP